MEGRTFFPLTSCELERGAGPPKVGQKTLRTKAGRGTAAKAIPIVSGAAL